MYTIIEDKFMGQADILRILECELKKTETILNLIKEKDIKEEVLWESAAKKEDIAMMLGISIDSIARSISKLIVQDKIVSLKNEKDKRKRKYMIKNERVNDLVNNGNSKL